MASRVVVIGLDGGTYDLLLPLIEQGHMPQLAQVLQNGGWGCLESTIPPFTASAWSTFATGKNPGQHGVLSFQQFDRFNYHECVTGFNDARQLQQPLWEMLSAAGKRVAVLNIPLSYPPQPVNGIMITGMMTPADAPEFTYPLELADALTDYRIDVDFIRDGDSFRRYGLPEKSEMLADIYKVTQERTAVSLRLLEQELWDFFMVVYTGTDRISHFFWDDLQPLWDKRPLSSSKKSIYFPDLIAYFHKLDRDISQLIDAAGPDAHVFFMSDHGFGSSPTKRFSVNLWLEQQQLLSPNQPQNASSLAYWRMKVGRNPLLKKALRRLMSQELQDKLAHKAETQLNGTNIVWSHTQAYFVPIYFHVCGIEVNTVGEHREGIVSSDEKYEAIRTQIITDAQQIRDPETGEHIVELVVRREDMYRGSYMSQFPDVILLLKPEYVGGQSLAGSELIEPYTPFRPGEHRPDGIFAAIGPYVQQFANLPNLQLADVAPTILYLLGLPVPTNFDGRILQELITPEHWAMVPPQYKKTMNKTEAVELNPIYSEDEEAELIERLRSLGYME